MSRLIAALCAVSLVACGGENATQPPPPPLPPITRLELADTSALVFTGSAVPGAAFVAHAYDATGAEVAHPVLTLAAGSGWTVRGDTLVAPSTEGRTTLRITAKRAEPTTADWVHLDFVSAQTVGTDSTASASMDVTAGVDLRASKWAVTLACRFAQPSQVHTSNNIPIDSLRVVQAPVDTIIYASDIDANSPTAYWLHNMSGVAQVRFSGPATRWLHDGSIDTATVSLSLSLAGQAPDTLLWSTAATGPRWPMALADSAPRRYVVVGGYAEYGVCPVAAPSALADTLSLTEVP